MFMVLVRFLFKSAFLLWALGVLVSFAIRGEFFVGLVLAFILSKVGELFGPTPDEFKGLLQSIQELSKP